MTREQEAFTVLADGLTRDRAGNSFGDRERSAQHTATALRMMGADRAVVLREHREYLRRWNVTGR